MIAGELSEDALIRFTQFRSDPWLFMKHCVWTIDEVDQKNPIKRYPAHLMYLYFIVSVLKRYKKVAIPKSRRMTVSWTIIAFATWEVIFHKGRFWPFLSKKEENAKELVSRAEFIIKHIPPEMISPELLPKIKNDKMQSSPPVLEFPEIYSKIQGFPQGGDQLRQYGCSGILEDECAFQEESEEAYTAAEPTIKGGGRMIKVSSRSVEDGGFFKKTVFDQFNAKDLRFPEIPPVTPMSPMEGIDFWVNPGNGFAVIDLHYTADPAKRGAEFKEGLKRSLPIRKYRMEYEKNWETFDGKPVYEDFNERIHVTHVKPKFHVGLPLLIGWDSSGLTPAVVYGQQQEEQLVIFGEIMGMGMGAHRFVPHVAGILRLNYEQLNSLEEQTISWFDPAGFKRNEITEQTYLQEMIKGGFKQIRPGAMTWNARVDAVVRHLVGLSKGAPKILIYEEGAPTLTAGLKGGFRYPDSVAQTEPDKMRAVKDIHSHPNDALQYLCSGLKDYRKNNYDHGDIPIPSYGFQKETHKGPQGPQQRKEAWRK